MKKASTFIPHTILLFAFFFTNSIIAGPSMPPPPPGLETPPPVSIDLYMIPMVIIGIIFAFFFIRKNTNV